MPVKVAGDMTFIASDFSHIAAELKRIEAEKAKVLAAPPPDEPAASTMYESTTMGWCGYDYDPA